jgi:hypothetical protein
MNIAMRIVSLGKFSSQREGGAKKAKKINNMITPKQLFLNHPPS